MILEFNTSFLLQINLCELTTHSNKFKRLFCSKKRFDILVFKIIIKYIDKSESDLGWQIQSIRIFKAKNYERGKIY